MIPGHVYTMNQIQTVWGQFAYDPHSIVWSDDAGESWNDVPGMDTGKWALFTLRDGKRISWVFRLKEPELKDVKTHE